MAIADQTAPRAGLALPAVRRMRALASLTDAETRLVLGLGGQAQTHGPGAELSAEDARARPRVLLSGWACRQRALPDGRRQIFSFVLPGEAIGLGDRPAPRPAFTIVALTTVVAADARSLVMHVADDPDYAGLRVVIDTERALEESWLFDHLVRIGRQTAYERTAHLMLEFHWRLTLSGLASGDRFPMPLTQEVLADALGLSVVHMNRTLQQLRRDKLIRLQSGEATLLEPATLKRLADFTPPPLERERAAWSNGAAGAAAELR